MQSLTCQDNSLTDEAVVKITPLWWSDCEDNSLTDIAILMKLYTGAVYNRIIQYVHVDEMSQSLTCEERWFKGNNQ